MNALRAMLKNLVFSDKENLKATKTTLRVKVRYLKIFDKQVKFLTNEKVVYFVKKVKF